MSNSELAKKLNKSVLFNLFDIIKSQKELTFDDLIKRSNFKRDLILEVIDNNKDMFSLTIISDNSSLNKSVIKMTIEGVVMHEILSDEISNKIINSINTETV